MATPKSPTLGRPLSFPHPHSDIPESTNVFSDQPTNRQSDNGQFTSVPLNDETSSHMNTEYNHSSANILGGTDTSQAVNNEENEISPSAPSAVTPEYTNTQNNPPPKAKYLPQVDTHGLPEKNNPPAEAFNGENEASSSETIRDGSSSSSHRTDQSDLHDPSEKRLAKAGVLAGSAAGAGNAARHVLVTRDGTYEEGGREPRGWKRVEVPDKWGIASKNIKEARWSAFKKALVLFGFITLWLWACLSIFWGSTYRLTSFLPSLTVHVIPFDTPSSTSYLNQPMIQQFEYVANEPSSVVHLGYQIKDPANYPNGLDDVRRSVIAQECWAAIVINANASSAWTNALNNGDASYDPSGAIGIYYSSARFYQVVLLYFDALISRDIANPLATARSQALSAFMSSSTTNTALLTNAARVPQAIGVGFGYTIFDVRPIQNYAWAGAAPMEASLIYFIIFAFYLCMYGGISRMKSGLGTRLRMSSMLGIRLGWPLLAYFFISLWQTLIVRAWQVPLTDHLGRAGFVTLWALNYVTIIASGLAMETMLAIIGISWLPFFLILWIICAYPLSKRNHDNAHQLSSVCSPSTVNITSSFYPIEMMPNFYRFLRWMPFVHNVEGYKIIAFGTNLQHRLGLHFGVIFAVIGVELICFPLALIFERWSMDRSKMREIESKKKEEKEKGHREPDGEA
ncbi:uncharacterized protein IL334_007772 [Kwoniella shivajii]|uniref:DUF3533 domain-containing protein n=1 Tax=Kwoniella shivajii TaxID=564305 RepID=A0ABZ1DA36_9TREE|nr:hypothetical protein IL334_007772 [Kwoniella shivajii]